MECSCMRSECGESGKLFCTAQPSKCGYRLVRGQQDFLLGRPGGRSGEVSTNVGVERVLRRRKASLARSSFANISPAPFRAYFTYGLGHEGAVGDEVLTTHPDSDLWLHAPAGATQIKWDYGIIASAYERSGEVTDGVEFTITGEKIAGQSRLIYSRLLDPAKQPTDRGRQHEVIPYHPLSGEILRFSSRPHLTPISTGLIGPGSR